MNYTQDRVRNWKWWAALTGVVFQGVAAFLRIDHGGTLITLLLSLLGLGVLAIWLGDLYGKSNEALHSFQKPAAVTAFQGGAFSGRLRTNS